MLGLTPPIGLLAPATPPAALRQGGTAHNGPGYVNPNGGLLPVP